MKPFVFALLAVFSLNFAFISKDQQCPTCTRCSGAKYIVHKCKSTKWAPCEEPEWAEPCPTCNGTGVYCPPPPPDPCKCTTCSGSGYRSVYCPSCSGGTAQVRCEKCGGDGRTCP